MEDVAEGAGRTQASAKTGELHGLRKTVELIPILDFAPEVCLGEEGGGKYE